MDLGDIQLPLLLASLIVAATPILLAALGELIVEKAGVLNLGVEGMMIFGAITGFIATIETGSPWIGFIFSILGLKFSIEITFVSLEINFSIFLNRISLETIHIFGLQLLIIYS